MCIFTSGGDAWDAVSAIRHEAAKWRLQMT